nr:unnamed protein product [Callosobruchus chinensis]
MSRNIRNQHRCPNCDRSYKRKGHLIRHLRIECNVPPALKCNICSRRFRYKHTLRRHEEICTENQRSKFF